MEKENRSPESTQKGRRKSKRLSIGDALKLHTPVRREAEIEPESIPSDNKNDDEKNVSVERLNAECEDEDGRILATTKENIKEIKKEVTEWDQISVLCPPVVCNQSVKSSDFVTETIEMLKSVAEKRKKAVKIIRFNGEMSQKIETIANSRKMQADSFQAYKNVQAASKY